MLITPDKEKKTFLSELPIEVVTEMVDNLSFFINVAFDETLWSKQREILYALKEYRRVCVRSCFSVGKSFIASRIAIAFSQTHPNSIVAITAPTYNQVKNILFREIHSANSKARIKLMGEPTTVEWNVSKGKWYMTGFSTDEADRVQGKHSSSVLAIIDESSGVDDKIIEAVESWGASGDFYELMIGNPLRARGRFYDSFYNPSFYKVSISAFDTPNFTGEKVSDSVSSCLINHKFVDDIKNRYGEESDYYSIAVLGKFPSNSDSSLFKSFDIKKAMKIDNIDDGDTSIHITCDIAYLGPDRTVIIIWRGFNIIKIYTILKNDIPEVVGWLKKYYNQYKADSISIDATGFGAGAYDMLKADGFPVYSVVFGDKAVDNQKYINLRTELYFNMFFAFREGRINIPDDPSIEEELLAQAYTLDRIGRFSLVKKSILRSGLSRSPDIADALAIRFADRKLSIGIG